MNMLMFEMDLYDNVVMMVARALPAKVVSWTLAK